MKCHGDTSMRCRYIMRNVERGGLIQPPGLLRVKIDQTIGWVTCTFTAMVLLIHKFLFWLFEIFWKDKETFVFLLCLENNLPLAHINSDLLNKNYCKKKKNQREREREKKNLNFWR